MKGRVRKLGMHDDVSESDKNCLNFNLKAEKVGRFVEKCFEMKADIKLQKMKIF
jgi:hypothetical protein